MATRRARKSAKCNGKLRYPTRDDALIALASCRGSRKRKRKESRVYRCHVCNGWHLTSREHPTKSSDELRAIAPDAVEQGHFVIRGTRWGGTERSKFINGALHALEGSGLPVSEWSNIWLWRKMRVIIEHRVFENRQHGDYGNLLSMSTMDIRMELDEFISLASRSYRLVGKDAWATPEQTDECTDVYAEKRDANRNPARLWVALASSAYNESHHDDTGSTDNEDIEED